MVEPWETLLKVFGGVVLAGVVGLVAAHIQRLSDHVKWIRERRFEAYLKAMQIADRIRLTFSRDGEDKETIHRDFMGEIADTLAAVKFLGPAKVSTALR